jgi:hypothetical protein
MTSLGDHGFRPSVFPGNHAIPCGTDRPCCNLAHDLARGDSMIAFLPGD